MKNKKGFTLVELLAVIVILSIILAIVIPRVTEYISKTRKDSFITTASDLVTAISQDATVEFYELPVANDEVTIISTDLIKLEKGNEKSSFNGKWIPEYSYVAIINVGTGLDPDYEYYIALKDTNRYTISLTLNKEITRDDIVRDNIGNNTNSITSICGSPDGEFMVIDNIIGLEKYRPRNGWNAIVYSSLGC